MGISVSSDKKIVTANDGTKYAIKGRNEPEPKQHKEALIALIKSLQTKFKATDCSLETCRLVWYAENYDMEENCEYKKGCVVKCNGRFYLYGYKT